MIIHVYELLFASVTGVPREFAAAISIVQMILQLWFSRHVLLSWRSKEMQGGWSPGSSRKMLYKKKQGEVQRKPEELLQAPCRDSTECSNQEEKLYVTSRLDIIIFALGRQGDSINRTGSHGFQAFIGRSAARQRPS
jgi:hypothetical protein